jgi:hypothetical protein
LVGSSSYATTAAFQELAARHGEILTAYRAREFAIATDKAEDAAKLAPDEVKGLYLYYQRRFDELIRSDLPPSWIPMDALKEK